LPARRRGDLWFGLGVIGALAVLCWVVITMQQLAADLHDANQARDLLARQVQQLGGHPVVGPPGTRGEPGAFITGPAGPRAEPGSTGPSGTPGRPGKDGAAGHDGDTGATGTDGQTGPTGPQGEQGPAGATGPQGEQGPRGDTGPEGPRGPAGPACPDDYTLQAPTWDPDALVCRRTSAPPAPGDGDGAPAPPVAAGLEPQRRQYP
jgi:Collagen triple helix repeat (20 copies)